MPQLGAIWSGPDMVLEVLTGSDDRKWWPEVATGSEDRKWRPEVALQVVPEVMIGKGINLKKHAQIRHRHDEFIANQQTDSVFYNWKHNMFYNWKHPVADILSNISSISWSHPEFVSTQAGLGSQEEEMKRRLHSPNYRIKIWCFEHQYFGYWKYSM